MSFNEVANSSVCQQTREYCIIEDQAFSQSYALAP